jgi:hypothetical protein
LKTAEERDFPMEPVVMQRMLKKYSASGCQITAAEFRHAAAPCTHVSAAIGRNGVFKSEARHNGRAFISTAIPFGYLNILLAI